MTARLSTARTQRSTIASTGGANRGRGGRTTEIHALTDLFGRPLGFSLKAGQVHELVGLGDLLHRIPTPRRLIADRAFDARKLRDWPNERGCEAVIPPNPRQLYT